MDNETLFNYVADMKDPQELIRFLDTVRRALIGSELSEIVESCAQAEIDFMRLIMELGCAKSTALQMGMAYSQSQAAQRGVR